MSGPDRAALVERMCVLVATAWDNEQRMQDGMSAALDLALEEVAKVVTEHYEELCAEHRLLLMNRAAAIRALKSTA